MKKLLISLLSIILLFFLLLGTYKLMNARSFQAFGGLTNKIETTEKVVALTFDDGPPEQVDQILTLLNNYEIKATFFLIGNELEKNLEQGERIAQEGHQIGNHTYSHQRMIFKTPSYIKEEIEKTNEWIRKTGYNETIDFRPPNGKKLFLLPYYLNKHGIETITWNLEPDTYATSAADKVNYVQRNIEPGSIILLHPMYDQTGKELIALEGIIKALLEEGYEFVTVGELKEMEG